jgi:hypothetical protein
MLCGQKQSLKLSDLYQIITYFVINSADILLNRKPNPNFSLHPHPNEKMGAYQAEMKEQNSDENLSAGATGGGSSTMVERSS